MIAAYQYSEILNLFPTVVTNNLDFEHMIIVHTVVTRTS